jgi:hypothetical protein
MITTIVLNTPSKTEISARMIARGPFSRFDCCSCRSL